MTDLAIPNPQEADSDEVRWALETARSLWANDAREALRWLRRAAETASDAGDDMRSVQLARAAADLRSVANIQASLPPPATPAQVGAPQAGPQPGEVSALPEFGAPPVPYEAAAHVTPSPYEGPPPDAVAPIAVSPAAVAMLSGQSAGATPVWAPESTPAQAEPVAATDARFSAAATVPMAAVNPQAILAAAQAAAAGPVAAPPAVKPPPLPPDFGAPPPAPPTSGATPIGGARPQPNLGRGLRPAVAAPPSDTSAPAPAAASAAAPITVPEVAVPTSALSTPLAVPRPPAAAVPSFISHQALRVVFNPASDEYGQLLVRPLIDGEEIPEGWVSALLVGLESGNVVFAGGE
jgi:hypothetical protein